MSIIGLLCVVLAFCFPLSTMAASGKCGQNARWELDNSGMLIISGEGRMKDFGSRDTPWRPDMVKYLTIEGGITHIGKHAFANTKITTVDIPASVISIGEGAFCNCKQLASVRLPFGLESIEKKAFLDCGLLSNINFPSSIKVIGNEAFANCRMLSTVSIPARLRSLGEKAFKNTKNLIELIELPDFVTMKNCQNYGLNANIVQKYFDHMSELAQSSSTQNNELPITAPTVFYGQAGSTTLGYGASDVDIDIPTRPQNNTNTYAVIIANENYGNMADVPFAINDGTSFATYCRMVLGIPNSNINVYNNASYGNMIAALSYISEIDNAYDGNINVIFYYAGHGAPDDATKDAFLIPVDAYKPVKNVCLSLDDLYSKLGNLNAQSVKVFIDACFSGATRDNTMLAQARAVAVVPKKSTVTGNTVVFSASTDSQTSWQYNDQEHGLFTYFLLKKLKETKGNVSLGELSEYLREQVGQMSITLNHKSQTPGVAVSPTINNIWHSWDMK